MHLWHSLQKSTCWDVRSNLSAGSRKESTQGTVDILRRTRSKVVYLRIQIQWIVFHGKLEIWDWTLRRDAREILRITWYKIDFGKEKRAIWKQYPKRWTSWAKSLLERFWGMNTWGNLMTSRLWQQVSVEFGEKCTMLSKRDSCSEWILRREGPKTLCRYWPRSGTV